MTDEAEKSHEPTQKKLDDARKKGEFARSADLTMAMGYGGWLVVSMTVAVFGCVKMGTMLAAVFANADHFATTVFQGGGLKFGIDLTISTFGNIGLWFLLPALFALLSVLGQNAFVVSAEKIRPKLNKLSPIQNAKNKFGRAGLFEFLKNSTKMIIYCVVLGLFLALAMDRIVTSVSLDARQITVLLGAMISGLMGVIVVVSFAIGGADFIWQRAEHRRKNMMSRQEIKDEMKQSEGDQQSKQQRRQKGIEIAMNKMLTEAQDADVVIVNPTHYAVALVWDPNVARPPTVVAKGVDEIAARIRSVAKENAIPIRSDPPTARAIYGTVEVGEVIRPEHYRAVAAAIRFADTLKKKVKNGG